MNRFRRLLLGSLLVAVGFSADAAFAVSPRWPSLAEQLAKDRVPPGSALERLIAQNQDFRLLAPEEANDPFPVPPWLRVYWRKSHPEIEMPKRDPAPSYPLVLKEIYEWMLFHPALEPARDKPERAPREKVTVGTNLRVSGAQTVARSESDIRINPWNSSLIISASNNIQSSGRQGMYWSTNAGSTWGQTLLNLVTGDALHSDPTVDWTSNGTAWSTTLGITSGMQLRLRVYRSTNNGATWTFDSTASGSQTGVDKQMVWADHGLMSPYVNNIYAIWHTGNPAYFNTRNGQTGAWGSVIQLSGAESTGTTIGADVRTSSAGHVFAFWPTSGNRQIIVRKSTNGGASFAAAVSAATSFSNPGAVGIAVPAFANRRILTYVSGGAYRAPSVFGTVDNVYVSWSDLSGAPGCNSPGQQPGTNVNSDCKTRIWFTRSTNGGATWEAKRMINDQAGKNDQFNQWLTVDETNGTVAIIYYDTVEDAGRKKTHVFYQASLDHGATWSQPFRITTAQTDETVAGAEFGNQYGDYNGLSGVARNFFPSWTDRRNNAREEIWTAQLSELSAPSCVSDGGADDTLYRQSCCSGVAVNGSTVCARPADFGGLWTTCNHVCGTQLVSGCVPSGGIDDTLYSTDCCSFQAVPGSTWCLDPADYGDDWKSCVQICA